MGAQSDFISETFAPDAEYCERQLAMAEMLKLGAIRLQVLPEAVSCAANLEPEDDGYAVAALAVRTAGSLRE